ncbi:TPA: hypothetical protein MB376_005065 [Klebsiella pneumoniae]|uniref:hypothetical protein n=1 Tax=Klebsiella pneumoniae TaxID=573 RepID=UPI0020413453|nr:hypothetical protein [Klebsiella pneumoniae]HBM2903937.1 hypothetical protein [Klebsiella oxytoca]HBY9717260.1 hypothetical protein [Klebsiella aerogenes]USB73038.1 hypothetical protein KU667_25930 [Klebsiella pneumoniae]HBM3284613.1 hypothetical protein [Klebsiella oxytoca]HBT4599354.1 hypothetical protein [Klebsiella pneumoniae]
MSNKGITADEARKNSQSSAFGADEVLEQLETLIQANSKAGSTSITSQISRERLSVKEIDEAISVLNQRGFKASYTSTTSIYTVEVSW